MFFKLLTTLTILSALLGHSIADGGVDQGPTGLSVPTACSRSYCIRKWDTCINSRMETIKSRYFPNEHELVGLLRGTYTTRCVSGKSSRANIAATITFKAPQCRILGCAEMAIRMRKWCNEKGLGSNCTRQVASVSRNCLYCLCGSSYYTCYVQSLIDGR